MSETTHPASVRRSGVLCHVTSLATPHGVGDLGPDARSFVDFLTAAGQTLWQVLPLGPPAHNDSPYSCYSAMAGNRIMISADDLMADGLVTAEQVAASAVQRADVTFVDFWQAAGKKDTLLQQAYETFKQTLPRELVDGFSEFESAQSHWLTDFARFEALMVKFETLDWTTWPDGLPQREPQALAKWDAELADAMSLSRFVQFLFDRQWQKLRDYAKSRGVEMCGDMPIFVAHESSDVWVKQNLFHLDEAGKPALVAGVPPDYFSETGQLWGNPLYDWEANEAEGFDWWTARFSRAMDQFDSLRVDHFRGFEAYWEVTAGEKTAINGRWVKGPGEKPFRAAEAKLGPLPFIAEDLGMITEEVYELRDALNLPGMRVLQFGFDSDDYFFHRPAKYPVHSVAYTGTHDNDTVMGWFDKRKSDPKFMERMAPYLKPYAESDLPLHWQLVSAVLQSDAMLTIVPIQDLLGLGNEARMNVPGKAEGNWAWRLAPDVLTDQVAKETRTVVEASKRI